ncbi:MAG: sugar kinase [Opitutaceae bacterium]
MKPTLCFGEIMVRLSPPGYQRLRQAMPGRLEATFAGAEANAAVAISTLGGTAAFITALPANEIADACLAMLRAAGVQTDRVHWHPSGRMGLYFVETGSNQRGGLVVYDRDQSVFSQTPPAAYDWIALLDGAGWLHVSGISAGVSRLAAESTLAAVRAARAAGLTVSFDLNHRRKLWRWDESRDPAELAREVNRNLLANVDVVIGSAGDLAAVAGLPAPAESDPDGPGRATALAVQFCQQFPQVRWVAVTLREGLSGNHNRWGAVLIRASDRAAFAAPSAAGRYQPYSIEQIVDRIGTGDAFAGALILALQTPDLADPQTALDFAVAASCLAHSIPGDFNFCTRAEVEALMAGGTGGAVDR